MYRKCDTFLVTSKRFAHAFCHFVWISNIFVVTLMMEGHAVAQLFEALRYNSEGHGFDSRWCHWNYSLTYSFWSHYGHEVDSASNRNEYQEYFLGGKGGRYLGLTTYHLHEPTGLKCGSLNILKPSGPVQDHDDDCDRCYVTNTFYILQLFVLLHEFEYPSISQQIWNILSWQRLRKICSVSPPPPPRKRISYNQRVCALRIKNHSSGTFIREQYSVCYLAMAISDTHQMGSSHAALQHASWHMHVTVTLSCCY